MFNTSKDILNLLLAVSAVGISFFICWLLYYVIASIRRVYNVINLFHSTLNSANNLINNFTKKFKSSSTYLKIFGVLSKKIFEEFRDAKQKKKEKTNTKNVKTKKLKIIKKTKK